MIDIAVRLSGIALTVGAVLLGAAIVLVSLNPVINQPFPLRLNVLSLLAAILLLLSLPAMYARQAQGAGWLGLAGHALLQTGMLLLVMLAAPPLLYPSFNRAPGERPVAFLLGIALTLGLLLTGVAVIQAGIYPRGAGIVLLAATAGFLFCLLCRRVSAAPGGSDRRRVPWRPDDAGAGLDWCRALDEQTRAGALNET